jgi:2-haloacid dehalogenase
MKFLFDLGGVFFDWDPKFFLKNIFTNEEELDYFIENICNDNWNLKQDKGRSIIEGEKDLIEKFPEYEDKIKIYYPNHRKMFKNVFQESVDILLKLKHQKYLCYVLSNWSSETFIGMKDDYDFLNKFDGMIISGEEKLVKPDEEIYKLAIKRFSLIPEETIFIDDRIENINSAKLLDFKTIHLTDPKKIKEKIEELI